MLYAPLDTLICIDSAGRIRLAVDQPGTLYVSFADPVITELGLERIAQRALRAAPLSDETRRTYLSKVRGYLTWLAAADADGDPLTQARDSALRDCRAHLVTVAKSAPRTINAALVAIDDFYCRRGLGPASADRLDLPTQAPRASMPRPHCGGYGPSPPAPRPATGCWPCSRSRRAARQRNRRTRRR